MRTAPNTRPIILLAFANEDPNRPNHLRNIAEESNALNDILTDHPLKKICEVIRLPYATLDQIIDTFQNQAYRGRIAIFHFAGHANSYELLLQSYGRHSPSMKVSGFVAFLAQQSSLKLVFLNGCLTALHAQELSSAGIPAIIGTVKTVDDQIAASLSIRFYKGLAQGIHLDRAWNEAIAHSKTQHGTDDLGTYYRDLGSKERPNKRAYDRFPWEIYYKDGHRTIKTWNLPEAANDPLFGLPDITEKYPLPNEPFQFLKRYQRKDAGVFFGRGRYIRSLYNRVTSELNAPVLCLYGQSGVGKSSLLEAGLLPRLEEDYIVKLIRRDDDTSIVNKLSQAFQLEENLELAEEWRNLESLSKKPVIIVVDQFERLWTKPIDGHKDELPLFLKAIQHVFNPLEENPKGKLILSYRKEFDPEIEQALTKYQVFKEKEYVDKFSETDIVEVVKGIASTPQLADKYGVTIDSNLPQIIANNLLKDSDAPISPVLQIILTKLWDKQRVRDHKAFTVNDYNELQSKGILLDEFFDQQMLQIKTLEQEIGKPVESSGLALDVLHAHTNKKYPIAETISLDYLRGQYEHQHEIINELVTKFEDLYLLHPIKKTRRSAWPDEEKQSQEIAPEKASTLSHDTLAPIVKDRMRQSERPGQKAYHILAAKMAVYNPQTTLLLEDELALVEEGENGMRIWTAKEKKLIAKSRQERENQRLVRQRFKFYRRLAIGSLVAIVLGIGGFGYWSNLTAKFDRKLSNALQMEREDPTEALNQVNAALASFPKNPTGILAREGILANHFFYFKKINREIPFIGIEQASNQPFIAAFGRHKIEIIDLEGQHIDSLSVSNEIKAIAFHPLKNELLITGVGGIVSRYAFASNNQGSAILNSNLFADSVRVNTLIYANTDSFFVTGDRDGEVAIWKDYQREAIDTFAAHPEPGSSFNH